MTAKCQDCGLTADEHHAFSPYRKPARCVCDEECCPTVRVMVAAEVHGKAPKRSKPKSIRFFDLFAWRTPQFPEPMYAEELVDSLTVEELPYESIPARIYPMVIAFRHISQTARVAAARRYYTFCQLEKAIR